MEDYKNSLNFWNDVFKPTKGYSVNTKFVTDKNINRIFTTLIKEDSTVLDFGCGSGWGLMEMYLTKNFQFGIGIDPSCEGIRIANECAKISNLNNLKFIIGNETLLKEYQNNFDFIFSTNLLDVVPDEITINILEALKDSLKTNGYLLVCLNPIFTEEELIGTLKMVRKGKYLYKNDILRCNLKSVEEWKELFSKYFIVNEADEFKLSEEEKYVRRYYLLQKK